MFHADVELIAETLSGLEIECKEGNMRRNGRNLIYQSGEPLRMVVEDLGTVASQDRRGALLTAQTACSLNGAYAAATATPYCYELTGEYRHTEPASRPLPESN